MNIEQDFTDQYSNDGIYNMVYNLMLLDHLRDVHVGYMEEMKHYFLTQEEFEKCENIKQYISRLIKNGKEVKYN